MQPSWYLGYARRWWSHPLSTPGNLSQKLQKCEAVPGLLSSLALEYRVDEQAPKLLQTLAAKFPHLTTLEVHRLRSEQCYHVAVVSGNVLSSVAFR